MNFDAIYTIAVQKIGRTLWWKENLQDDGKGYDGIVKPFTMAHVDQKWDPRHTLSGTSKDKPDANLISSLLENGMHAPAIDIDLPCHLVPSTNPGHYHLYFDKEMTWEQYEKLLTVMTEVGLVEKGYLDASRKFKQSYLRLPHVKKKGA